MSFTSKNKTTKRKSITAMSSPVNSVASYASTSTSSMNSSISGSSNNWLPPISTLLSHLHDNNETNKVVQYDYNTTPYYHQTTTTTIEPHIVVPKPKKRKTQLKKPQRQEKVVFMPMIPYYFHHEKFGIEACMLQLEGQKKFNNFYYV
ncbi:unnamed protein product [Mucor hiemalis]